MSLKNHTRKISKIHKDSELYQLFMHNFLYQNVPRFPLYILFILEESTHFGLELVGQFGIKNEKRKISNVHKDFLNCTNFSWIIFYAHFTFSMLITVIMKSSCCILPKLLTTWLIQSYAITIGNIHDYKQQLFISLFTNLFTLNVIRNEF